MILDQYNTAALSGVDQKSIRKQVTEAAIACGVREGIFRLWDEAHPNADREQYKYYKGVDAFTQPILFNLPGRRDPLIAVNFRNLKGESAYIKEVRDVQDTIAAVTLHCAIENTAEDLYQTVAQAAFANILTGVVTGSFGIESRLKGQLYVVAAAHYYNITHGVNPETGYGDAEKLVMMRDIIAATHQPLELVNTTVDLLKVGSSVNTFIENVKIVDGTDRVNRLNAGLITNTANDLWYGLNAGQTVMAAFEHAPTFCALLYAALGKGGYSRSEFAKNLRYMSIIQKKGEAFSKSIRAIKAEYGDEY